MSKNLLFAKSHEWLKVEGNIGTIGISDHAQDSLGSIVFVELPQIGDEFNKGESFGAVESVKAASDLYMPVSGKVIEVNESLEDAPEAINDDAYGTFIMKIEITNLDETKELLNLEQYEDQIEE